MLVLLCLSIGLITGRMASGSQDATRLGKRALLHVRENHKRVIVPVAPVSDDFLRRVSVVSDDGGGVPLHSLIFATDAHGTFVFPPYLPKGANCVRIVFNGKTLSETERPVPPDSWWQDLVARAMHAAVCV